MSLYFERDSVSKMPLMNYHPLSRARALEYTTCLCNNPSVSFEKFIYVHFLLIPHHSIPIPYFTVPCFLLYISLPISCPLTYTCSALSLPTLPSSYPTHSCFTYPNSFLSLKKRFSVTANAISIRNPCAYTPVKRFRPQSNFIGTLILRLICLLW
ncbi:hypothetical protein K469DRAFT_385616 [Zopfia rhizophila CBS 207.26]|uniref:Uncharacterized protein n=1 Tax=Zopfia rhizophila CBS 207.26 TaxID=1314779 RepID=A0A6A6EGP3_9PEZI|nr:hypothetical protein K469DRAFT_385616 [Zopfia rhizophila CBS 207.26]